MLIFCSIIVPGFVHLNVQYALLLFDSGLLHIHRVRPSVLLLLIDSIEVLRELTLIDRPRYSTCCIEILCSHHLWDLRNRLLLLRRSHLV